MTDNKEGNQMKAIVEKNECMGCKLCVTMCPEIFYLVDDEYAEAKDEELTDELSEKVDKVADSCPSMCISKA